MPEHGRFEIRRAAAADAAGILDCLSAAFAPYRDSYTAPAYRDTVPNAESLALRMRDMCLLVALTESGIAGTIGCQASGSEGHLRGMAVRPEWQGRGVAQALLSAAEAELRASGCRRVNLDTTGPLERAARFYRKHGYAPSGRVADFFGMRLAEYAKTL